MTRKIGVMAMEHIAVGLDEELRLVGAKRVFPDTQSEYDSLAEMPAEQIAQGIAAQVQAAADGGEVAAIGVGFPGIISANVVEDSPNLQQMKGQRLGEQLQSLLADKGVSAPVFVLNDADAIAAGIAATRGQLDSFVRVWALGSGVGFGRYPLAAGVWANGHTVVSLDPKETFCRCRGAGHAESRRGGGGAGWARSRGGGGGGGEMGSRPASRRTAALAFPLWPPGPPVTCTGLVF